MTLEQAIHQRWAADETLSGLLPADRVTTGRASDASVPYATLVRGSSRTLLRTNAGDALDEVGLEIHVWHDDYDACLRIVAALKSAFDRSDFPLSEGRRVVQIRRRSDTPVQHPDGLWQWTITFVAQVYLPAGV
jgi:hypothetical protein